MPPLSRPPPLPASPGIERRRTEALVAQLGVTDVGGWLEAAETATIAELERHGEMTAQELARAVPTLAA